jgi:alanyl-tRNA synthetase
MAHPAYQRDAYLKELDTEVVEVGREEGREFAVTEDSVFYPEGGGQPTDRGTMGDVEVVDVRRADDKVKHYLSASLQIGPVHQSLDWDRRFDHMQQHTAQHMITAIGLERFGWPTTAFHLGPSLSDIELDVSVVPTKHLVRLEDAVNEEIRAARPVCIRYAARDRMVELGVRSRLLPQDFTADELRLVDIDGLDINTCGGTHVRSTAEIGAVALVATEPMRGGTRVLFVAGDRVRRRLSEHEERNARLRSILDTADDDMPEIVQLRLDKEKKLARDRRRIAEELVELLAASLAREPGAVVSRHWDDRDMEFLQRLGRRFVEEGSDKVALLTAGSGGSGFFVVAAGENAGINLSTVGPEVADLLVGRGGGTQGVFQGKASGLGKLDEAVRCIQHHTE